MESVILSMTVVRIGRKMMTVTKEHLEKKEIQTVTFDDLQCGILRADIAFSNYW